MCCNGKQSDGISFTRKLILKKSIKFVSKMVTTLICLFIVMQKRVMKYMTRIGQNTGMLKTWKKVQQKAITYIGH